MKYDVFTLILDSNSTLAKDAEAFHSTVSKYTRDDSTVLIISANSSVDRVIAGAAPQSLAAVPKLTNIKTKGDYADRVFSWIIEVQCTREAEGKESQALGVLYDCNSFSDRKLLERLKAKRELSVIDSSPPKKPQLSKVLALGILLGALLGLFSGYYIGLYYPGRLFGEPVQEIDVFADVLPNAFYADAVAWAVANGITNGTESNKFSPNDPCTRAQIVTFLWRSKGEPQVSITTTFTDVEHGSYYEMAVAWAVANGITKGTGEGKFSPNDPCTRAHAVSLLYRAEGTPAATGSSFNDVAIDLWYTDAVSWAMANEITNGTGNGKFSPDNTCTRAQIVTFLYRAMA